MESKKSFAGEFSPGYCPEEILRRHLLGRAWTYLLRGLAAALLMPIEVLDHLRRGSRNRRRIWVSWILSTAICASGFAIWTLSRATFFDGHDRASQILGYCLVLLAAGIVSGRLQTRESPDTPEHWSRRSSGVHNGWRRGHGQLHRDHHDYRGHRHSAHPFFHLPSGFGTEGGEEPEPAQQLAASGVCRGDCRECREDVCVKTGRPKRRRTA